MPNFLLMKWKLKSAVLKTASMPALHPLSLKSVHLFTLVFNKETIKMYIFFPYRLHTYSRYYTDNFPNFPLWKGHLESIISSSAFCWQMTRFFCWRLTATQSFFIFSVMPPRPRSATELFVRICAIHSTQSVWLNGIKSRVVTLYQCAVRREKPHSCLFPR